jgi:hypothetical protein
MKIILKLILGFLIFSIIFYMMICLYFFAVDYQKRIIVNNCRFNYTNCSFDYIYNVTKAVDNLEKNYNSSIQQIINIPFFYGNQ